MESYKLTAKEFVFLCAAAGTEIIYGIENAYQNKSEGDMLLELTKVHKDLVKKRYVRFDFDGNSTISKKLLACIHVCANCEQVVLFQITKEGADRTLTYYDNAGQIVRLAKEKEAYELCSISAEQMRAEILTNLKFAQIQSNTEPLHLTMNRQQAEEFKQAVQIKGFFSLTVIHSKQNQVENWMMLETEKEIFSMEPTMIRLENMVCVKRIGEKEINTRLRKILGMTE